MSTILVLLSKRLIIVHFERLDYIGFAYFFQRVTFTISSLDNDILGSSVQGGWNATRKPWPQRGNQDPE